VSLGVVYSRLSENENSNAKRWGHGSVLVSVLDFRSEIQCSGVPTVGSNPAVD